MSRFLSASTPPMGRAIQLGATAFVLVMTAAHAHAHVSQALPAGDPRMHEVSGVLVPEAGDEPSPTRTLLLVPQAAVNAVAIPLRGGLQLYERHHVQERVLDLFFDDSRTFGIYPRLTLETRTSVGVGLRIVHRDLFGTGIRFKLAGDGGGEYQQRVDASLHSPDLLGLPLRLHLRGGVQRQARAPFYGIGDPYDAPALADPASAPRDDLVYATHFHQRISRAQLGIELDPAGPWFGNVDVSFVSRRFSQDAQQLQAGTPGSDLTEQLTTLPEWSRGTDVVYMETQVGFDSSRATSPYVPASAPATGGKVALFGGVASGIGDDRTRYLRYGLEARRYFDLFAGDRVLLLRAYAEGVTAAGAETDIPFTDLPRLGGPQLLRGYTRDRFRDRLAVVGTVEYRYPIWSELAGFLFVDGGRVLPGPDALASLVRSPSRLRAGAGGGLELHQGNSFRMRGQLAGSADGMFLQLSLEPAYRVTSPSYRI